MICECCRVAEASKKIDSIFDARIELDLCETCFNLGVEPYQYLVSFATNPGIFYGLRQGALDENTLIAAERTLTFHAVSNTAFERDVRLARSESVNWDKLN